MRARASAGVPGDAVGDVWLRLQPSERGRRGGSRAPHPHGSSRRLGGLPVPAMLSDAVVAVEDGHFYSNVMINVLDGVGRADSPHSRHARTLAAARSSGSSPSSSMDVGAGSLQRFARSASASSARSPTPRRRSSTCISTSSTTATATGATSPCARLLRHHPRRARLGPGATASSVAVSNPAPVAAASPRWRRGPAGSCIAIAFPSATDCRLRVAPRKTEDVRRT